MIEVNEILSRLEAVTTPEQRAVYGSSFYIAITNETRDIIKEYRFKNLVEVFTDQVTRKPWYEIPFVVFPPKY